MSNWISLTDPQDDTPILINGDHVVALQVIPEKPGVPTIFGFGGAPARDGTPGSPETMLVSLAGDRAFYVKETIGEVLDAIDIARESKWQ